MNLEYTAKVIRNLRKKHHLTQKEFAEQLGVTYQAVSKWENGKNMPDILLLKKISSLFDIDIEELLMEEKKREPLKREKYFYIIWLLIVMLLIIIIILVIDFYKEHSSFEFKTMASSCEEFTLTGSAAYNNKKTSIYISNVDYCGNDTTTIYSSIECTLYEDYRNTKTKIGSCGKSTTKMTLDEFLDTVQINVNNYVASCKMFTSSALYLEIQALDEFNQNITYQIPIQLEENCNQ